MKLSLFLLATLAIAAPALVRADGRADFERDAKPILEAQPGLVQYIHAHFVVKETGLARVAGNDDQPPQPPFIFNARPRSASGPFYLRLLIQPGPPGRILKVADVRRLPQEMPAPPAAPEPVETAQAPASSSSVPHVIGSAAPATATGSSSQPTTETPSGPIHD
jgi:hypothetical protein